MMCICIMCVCEKVRVCAYLCVCTYVCMRMCGLYVRCFFSIFLVLCDLVFVTEASSFANTSLLPTNFFTK